MKQNAKKIKLIEDHHEAYYLWKKEDLKDKALVHLDAHIDFGFHDVKPIEQIFREAKTKEELKNELERLVLFKKFQFEEEKLTNIGNYIYPAMRDGIVSSFYWIIPGRQEAFKESLKDLKTMVKGFVKIDPYADKRSLKIKDSSIEAKINNKPFFISTLDNMPKLEDGVLLDIDVDYLTTPNLKLSNATDEIAKRSPWIYPSDLVGILKKKITDPLFVTVCYSVNGGFMPLKYKFLGDEIYLRMTKEMSQEADSILLERQKARNLNDWHRLKGRVYGYNGFKPPFKNNLLADIFYNVFLLRPIKKFYENAIRLNPSYRVKDNNYGPLYLMRGKIPNAESEFRKVLNVDRNNVFASTGLGNIYLKRRQFHKAKKEFVKVLREKADLNEALLDLGIAEFHLKNYDKAITKLLKYEEIERPNAESRYYLARSYELKRKFDLALDSYKNVLQLAVRDIYIILRILKILKKHKDGRQDMLKLIIQHYKKIKGMVKYSKRTKKKNRRFKLTKHFKRQFKEADRILRGLKCRRFSKKS